MKVTQKEIDVLKTKVECLAVHLISFLVIYGLGVNVREYLPSDTKTESRKD